MLDFIRVNPWAFVLGGSVFLVAAIGVIIGVVFRARASEPGLMVRGGKPLHWARYELPLPVWYDPRLSAAWVDAWSVAAAMIAREAGSDLFMLPAATIPEMDTSKVVGVTLIPNESSGFGHADTVLRWDKLSGQLLSAVINLPQVGSGAGAVAPPSISQTEDMAFHEGLHAIGFDPDSERRSIMHDAIRTGSVQALTAHDRDVLRKYYG